MKTKIYYTLLVTFLTFHPTRSFADCDNIDLIVMRHGHGEHIVEGIRNSQLSSPVKKLTATGIEETQAAARNSGFNKKDIIGIYSSPLRRTVETAAVFYNTLPDQKNSEVSKTINLDDIVAKTPIYTDARIIERNFGPCENTRITHDENDCYNQKDESGKALKFGAENDAKISARAKSFLENIIKENCDKKLKEKKYILISTHDVTALELIKLFEKDQKKKLEPSEFKTVSLGKYQKEVINNAGTHSVS